jgi:dTDP-4-dehydrorhamnose 3,5-epimerase
MNFVETSLQDVFVLEPKVFGDDRGFFLESWSDAAFADAGFDLNFVQDNHSRSSRGILRGLHYQMEHTQGKLVRVVSGSVFDVAVDLRRSSPTLGKWFGVTLSAENHKMLWVPPGFAHGFVVTSDYADFIYKCTDTYHPGSEQSLAWNDPTVGVEWPLAEGEEPSLSEKDAVGYAWDDAPKFD